MYFVFSYYLLLFEVYSRGYRAHLCLTGSKFHRDASSLTQFLLLLKQIYKFAFLIILHIHRYLVKFQRFKNKLSTYRKSKKLRKAGAIKWRPSLLKLQYP